MKTNHRKTNLYPDTSGKSQFITTVLCIMLLSPLFWRGVGGEVFAQVANGTGAGNCLSYDGVNDYVDCGNNSNLNLTTAWTFESWIKFNSFNIVSEIVAKRTGGCEGNPDEVNYWFSVISDASVGTGFYNGGWRNIFTSEKLISNTWYHLTSTWDNSTLKIYINGILKAQSSDYSATPPLTNIRTLNIGKHRGALFSYIDGQIDELSIWNYALTETEIRNNMCKKLTGSESGLVGYWRFDEGSGGTAYDASPNGNNGTLY